MAENTLSFEELYPAICYEIEKRRLGWTLTAVEFDDVKQIILVHVYKKWDKFDPLRVKGDPKTGFARWLQGLISSQISNIKRDNYSKYSRPCLSTPKEPRGCPFNTGGDSCSQTPSGKQCSECPIYAAWEKRKIAHFNIKQPLAMDYHSQEVENVQGDFLDVVAKKKIIDEKIQAKLTKHEWKIYRMLYIQNRSEKDVGKALKYKKVGKCHEGYQVLRKIRKKIIRITLGIIEEEGLAAN